MPNGNARETVFRFSWPWLPCVNGPRLRCKYSFRILWMVYVNYGVTSVANDLALVAPYSNSGFALAPQQGPLLKPYAFTHNFLLFNQAAILQLVYQNAGIAMPAPNQYGVIWHANYIPDFRDKYYAAYHQYLNNLKKTLTTSGMYKLFDIGSS